MEEIGKEMDQKVGLVNDNNQIIIREDHNNNNNSEAEGDNQGKINGGRKINNTNDQQKTTLRTPADIYEHPSFYSFILDMPGLDAHNIKVKVEKGTLHVSGKKKKKQIIGEPTAATTGNEGVKVIRIERRRARYMRKFTLSGDASHEDIKAAYKDGVLSIIVAKTTKHMSSIVDVQQSKPNSLADITIS